MPWSAGPQKNPEKPGATKEDSKIKMKTLTFLYFILFNIYIAHTTSSIVMDKTLARTPGYGELDYGRLWKECEEELIINKTRNNKTTAGGNAVHQREGPFLC